IRNRQGSRRAIHSSRVAAKGRSLRRVELRGASRTAPRVGVVRLRTRRVHRRPAGQAGTDRARDGRRAVPRRGQRDEPVGAGEALLRHHWPGNVRELRNALERAAILCEGGLISAAHLSLQPRRQPPPAATTTNLPLVERDTIEQVMRDCGWNKSKAAKRLGLSRTQLYVRLRRYELEQPAAN